MNNTPNKRLRAAIYLRVSTNEQATTGYGLAVQEEKLKAFAIANDYTLDEKHIYRDEGFSGSLSASERPGALKLFADAKNREFDIILVYRLDRLFRDATLLLNTLKEFREWKMEFKSVTESFDTTTVYGKGMVGFLSIIAEMERDTIRERTTNGRISAAKDGKWVTGVPPYGYRVDDETQKLKVVPEEAKWVKTFFRWIVEDRLSLREVQKRANSMKIPLPRRKVSKKDTLNVWHKRTLGRIVTNETYTGSAYYRKYKRPFNNLTSLIDENLLRDRAGWVEIKVPEIVPREVFDACTQQLLRNREFSKRNQKRNYLFSKIIYCGSCGFKLFGGYQPPKKDGNNGSKYYHGMCTKMEVGTTQRCPACEQIAETRLYPIWDKIKDILKKPELTLERLRKYNEERISKDDTEERLQQIDKSLKSLTLKRYRLGQIYSEDEGMDHENYKKSVTECREQEDKLRQDKMRLERRLLDRKGVKKMAELIESQYARLAKKLDSLTYDEQQEALRLLVKRVIVYPKKAEAEVELNFNAEKQANSHGLAALVGVASPVLWDNNANVGLTISEGNQLLRDNNFR
ncbi:MAG: recombinase family protein [Candidatus Paceibacterota bacterium]